MENLIGFEEHALQTNSSWRILIFNTLAGVPGTPLLKLDGEKINYMGFRLWRIQTVSEYLEEDSFRLVGCMV